MLNYADIINTKKVLVVEKNLIYGRFDRKRHGERKRGSSKWDVFLANNNNSR